MRFSLPMPTIAAGFVLTAPLIANAVVLDAFDSGSYRDDGNHSAAQTSIDTGTVGGREFRSFLAFDLAGLSGTITGAALTFSANGVYDTDDDAENLRVAGFEGDIDALLAATGGIGAFNDLGAGTAFANAIVITNDPNGPMPTVSVSFDSSGVAALNAVLANADRRVVFGGAITSLGGADDEFIWGGSASVRSSLSLVFSDVQVPEPGTLLLLATGVLVVRSTRRRA